MNKRMSYIAFRMLVNNRKKYLGIIFGITFASFMMTHPLGVFLGSLTWTFGLISDIALPDIWVMDPTVQFLDDAKPMPETSLYRVASVEGVAWAKPLFKGVAQARLLNGTVQTCRLVGIDDATFIGAPSSMVQGRVEDLRRSNGIIVNEQEAKNKLANPPAYPGGPKVPLQVGQEFELNNHRVVVVGIAKTTPTFESNPLLFTTYANATRYVPPKLNLLSFILVKANPGENLKHLCDRIKRLTGLTAYTKDEFKYLTTMYYLKYTGILINFCASMLIGFLVGAAITGQIFYSFTLENLPYFGLLKAMGTSEKNLISMILLQALIAALIGYGIGLGATGLMVFLTKNTRMAFSFPWQLFFLSIGGVVCIASFAAFLSIRKVIRLEPAIVFKS